MEVERFLVVLVVGVVGLGDVVEAGVAQGVRAPVPPETRRATTSRLPPPDQGWTFIGSRSPSTWSTPTLGSCRPAGSARLIVVIWRPGCARGGRIQTRSMRTWRWRAAPGGGMWSRSWPGSGSGRIWLSRPTLRGCGVDGGTRRLIGLTLGICGRFLLTAGCRSAGSRRRTSWRPGHCWRPTGICEPSTRRGCSVFTRCCSITAPARCWPISARTPDAPTWR